MITSALIIGFSLVLLVYWFRYSCVLLLRNDLTPVAPAADSRFNYGEVQRALKSDAELDPLHRSLRRDFEVFTYLVEHASGLELASIEDRLLILDYRFMQLWYGATKALFPNQARQSLAEMASVLDILVRHMGEHAESYTKA